MTKNNFIAFRTKILTNNKQASILESWANCAKHSYNFANRYALLYLEQNKSDKTNLLNFLDDVDKMYNAGKRELGVKGRPGAEIGNGLHTWYNDSLPLGSISQSSISHLKDAWKRYFKKESERPRFKNKASPLTLQLSNSDLEQKHIKGNQIKLPKFNCSIERGTLKLAEKIPHLHLKICYSTITREHGIWYLSITFKGPFETLIRKTNIRKPSVGVDIGINIYAATSDGDLYLSPARLKENQANINNINAQIGRAISINLTETVKCCKFCILKVNTISKKRLLCNKCKQELNKRLKSRKITRLRTKISKLYKSSANIRANTSHKLTKSLCMNYDFIAIEDLKIKNMTKSAKGSVESPGNRIKQKSGLNRALLNIAPYKFRAQLEYKKKYYQNEVKAINPRNTSRECPSCNHISADNRKSQALFLCVICGHTANADVNASINIENRGLAARVTNP
jgi:putative transposase